MNFYGKSDLEFLGIPSSAIWFKNSQKFPIIPRSHIEVIKIPEISQKFSVTPWNIIEYRNTENS